MARKKSKTQASREAYIADTGIDPFDAPDQFDSQRPYRAAPIGEPETAPPLEYEFPGLDQMIRTGFDTPPVEIPSPSQDMRAVGEAFARGLGESAISTSVNISALARAIAGQITRRQEFDFDPNPQGRECTGEVAVKNYLYPYDHRAESYMFIPLGPVKSMERRSGYSARAIAGAYHHWWVRWYEKDGPIIPWDLGIYVIELHTREGYAPPWADVPLDQNLRAFQAGLQPGQLLLTSKTFPIATLAKGYYQIFLAKFYPEIADPGIRAQIETPPPVVKPLDPPGPRERKKRTLSVTDLIVDTQYRSARK